MRMFSQTVNVRSKCISGPGDVEGNVPASLGRVLECEATAL